MGLWTWEEKGILGLTARAGAVMPAFATPPTAVPVFQRLLVLENAGWEEAGLLAEAGVERPQAEAWLLGPSCLGALEANAKHPFLRLCLGDLRGATLANLLGLGRLAEAASVAEACLRPTTGTWAASGRWEAFVALGEVLAARGCASFLAVIKDFGEGGRGVLSFPRPGVTIALDIPLRKDTQETIDALNRSVIEEGGRIYLTKDSCTRAEDFAAMEPRLAEFEQIRDKWDPERQFRSAQSVRLLGDPQ